VTIPAGQGYAYFQVEGVEVGATTISATTVGYQDADFSLDVVMPTLSFSNLPGSLKTGQTANFTIIAAVPGGLNQAASTDVTFTVTSAVPGVANVSGTPILRAGTASSTPMTLNGIALGTTTVTASASGFVPITSSAITIQP
jgi:hypothetical protein